MNSFRQINKRILLLWSLLLSLALLCVQEVGLHSHTLDHEHNDHHSHSIDEADDHGHLSKAHFTHDTSHTDHHNGAISDIDISPDGLLKNTGNSVFAIALFAFFFTLMTLVFPRQLVQCCRESKLAIYGYYILSPPLRAPPLH